MSIQANGIFVETSNSARHPGHSMSPLSLFFFNNDARDRGVGVKRGKKQRTQKRERPGPPGRNAGPTRGTGVQDRDPPDQRVTWPPKIFVVLCLPPPFCLACASVTLFWPDSCGRMHESTCKSS